MKRSMNIFTHVQVKRPKRSLFDLSHDLKMSGKMGCLIPTNVIECLPGDEFTIGVQNMVRFAPLIAPVMHRVRVKTEYFFVPTRLLWDKWERWITGDLEAEHPFFPISDDGQVGKSTLLDYLGYPVEVVGSNDYSPFPIYAYNKIWNEWYRDQNLQEERLDKAVDGDNGAEIEPFFTQEPARRAWEHDYFTSCLPFAQKGETVSVPLTGSDGIPVEFTPGSGKQPNWRDPSSGLSLNTAYSPADPYTIKADTTDPKSLSIGVDAQNNPTIVPAGYDPDGTLKVDVQAGATDITTLRRAFRLQEWLEKNARAGTRYVENILAHFGIHAGDARLQRPEMIGSFTQNMVISEVLATAENENTGIAVGSQAGHGISFGGSGNMRFMCREHGWILGIISVIPDTAYPQSVHRSLINRDRLDYAWPTFANIGEQEVKLRELYPGLNSIDNPVFGYIPRYAEYKYINSRVAGEMRDTLDFWHLGRKFANPPALNSDFIECRPSTRIFAVTDPNEDHLFFHIMNNVKAKRPLPYLGSPTI